MKELTANQNATSKCQARTNKPILKSWVKCKSKKLKLLMGAITKKFRFSMLT